MFALLKKPVAPTLVSAAEAAPTLDAHALARLVGAIPVNHGKRGTARAVPLCR